MASRLRSPPQRVRQQRIDTRLPDIEILRFSVALRRQERSCAGAQLKPVPRSDQLGRCAKAGLECGFRRLLRLPPGIPAILADSDYLQHRLLRLQRAVPPVRARKPE